MSVTLPASASYLRKRSQCVRMAVMSRVTGASEPRSTAAAVGSAFHRIAELYVRAWLNGSEFDVESARPTGLFPDEWNEVVELVKAFVERFPGRFKGLRPSPEIKMAVNADGKPVTWDDESAVYRGVIDLMLRLDRETMLIVDYKTGAAPPDGDTPCRADRIQLMDYAGMCACKSPDLKKFQVAVWNTRFDTWQDLHLERHEVMEHLHSRIMEAKGDQDTTEWPASPGFWCRTCPVAQSCPQMGSIVEKIRAGVEDTDTGSTTITDGDTAVKIANDIMLAEAFLKRSKASMSDWYDTGGTRAEVGEMILDYESIKSWSAPAKDTADALVKAGIPMEVVWEKGIKTLSKGSIQAVVRSHLPRQREQQQAIVGPILDTMGETKESAPRLKWKKKPDEE